MYKVIGTDNYDMERFSDILVQDGLTKEEAELLAKKKNDEATEHEETWAFGTDDTYYMAVPEDRPMFSIWE